MNFPRASSLAILAVLAGGVAIAPRPALAQLSIGISVTIAPPALPVYVQPPLPEPDYIWVPGYWAWDTDVADYYWVPGTWVSAPQPGYLWTPGYWGWGDGAYVFHQGYWGPHIGYYGGINYGFGYTGSGFQGGYWQGPHYFYNRNVNNITNVHVTNVYNKTVIINRTTINNVSFNGGPGGIVAAPTQQELAAEHEHHIAATELQSQHIEAARTNHALYYSANHGAPAIAATARPGDFKGPGVVRAAHAGVSPQPEPVARPAAHAPGAPSEPKKIPAGEHPPGASPMSHPESAGPAPVHPKAEKPPRPETEPRPPSQPAFHPEAHPESHPQSHPEAMAPRPQPQMEAPKPPHEEKHNPS